MYNELVYHLDLCTLAYQLHAQTIAWPLDPYYEELSSGLASKRNAFMAALRQTDLAYQTRLDPVKYAYADINPTRPAIVKPRPVEWLIYNTPADIHNKIRTVFLKEPGGAAQPSAPILNLPPGPARTDDIYCFKGTTGAVYNYGGNVSLMGFVLINHTGGANNDYNVHIAFRGSRSGSALREASKGVTSGTGNPDWVTDMNLRKTVPNTDIVDNGEVCLGFSLSLMPMVQTIYTILTEINAAEGRVPLNIYIAGHSLGGALATHLASALCYGAQYGAMLPVVPAGAAPLAAWPWQNLKVYTYGAPVVGDKAFQYRCNMNIQRFNIGINGDIVTQSALNYHTGVELKLPRPKNVPISPDFHEPYVIRRLLLKLLAQDYHYTLAGIPANVAREFNDPWDADEPWQKFSSFSNLPAARKTAFALTAGFNANLVAELVNYLQLLHGVSDTPAKKIQLAGIITTINLIVANPAAITVNDLNTTWLAAKAAVTDTNWPIKFWGLCLIVTAIYSNVPNVLVDLNGAQYADLKRCLD
jgi:pimeloyl-ACP methyl ester carboxylesterase